MKQLTNKNLRSWWQVKLGKEKSEFKKLQQISVPLISVLFLGNLCSVFIVMWISDMMLSGVVLHSFWQLRGIGEIFRAMGPLVLIGLGFSCQSCRLFNAGLSWSVCSRTSVVGFAWSNQICLGLVLIPLTVIIALISGGIVGAGFQVSLEPILCVRGYRDHHDELALGSHTWKCPMPS